MTSATSHDPNGRHRDPLTGAVTETALLRFLDAVLSMAESVGPQIGMMCLGIDDFEALSARYGKAVCDAVLLGVADRMHERVRSHDLVARIDDGFGICLADVFPAQAVAAAERLRRSVTAQPLPTPAGMLQATCSVGLVLSRGEMEGAAAMVKRARAACDAARQAGGNRLLSTF